MSARPSLLIVSISKIVSDPRVLKQVQLFRDVYDVSTCGQGPAPEGVVRHFELPADARGWVDDKASVLLRRYARGYWNIQAVKAAKAILPVAAFDGVLANDLNTVPLALSLQPRLGVHADLHEFAPREKEDNLQWRLFVAPFMRWLCRTYLPRVTSATTVSAGIAREYEKDYGVEFDVVTNAAPYAEREPRPVGDPIRLIHSAAGQRYRRLENFIEVMKDAPPGIELDLIVVPHEPSYVAELKQLGSGVPHLHFRDPVPYAQLVDTLAEYDAAIAFLPPTNFNLANALPNKFFEAVQARIGLIIGPSPEMARILDEYELGVATADFEVDSLRKALAGLDRETMANWKRAAHRAARALSSEQQMQGWSRAIAALLGR